MHSIYHNLPQPREPKDLDQYEKNFVIIYRSLNDWIVYI